MEKNRYYTVKEIADLVGVSRQTLIYYDSIGLFKPEFVDSNGYRKYSAKQLMELREILFFKNNGIPLDFIKQNLRNQNLEQIRQGLKQSKNKLLKDIEDLNKKVSHLNNRIHKLDQVAIEMYTVSVPLIKYFPERVIFWLPWQTPGRPTRSALYETFMEVRKRLDEMHLSDDLGWGGVLRQENLRKENWTKDGGSFVYIPTGASIDLERYGVHIEHLPAGEYLCMNCFGMPYERETIDELLDWADKQGIRIVGNLINECMLDVSYLLQNGQEVDFSQLQVKIER